MKATIGFLVFTCTFACLFAQTSSPKPQPSTLLLQQWPGVNMTLPGMETNLSGLAVRSSDGVVAALKQDGSLWFFKKTGSQWQQQGPKVQITGCGPDLEAICYIPHPSGVGGLWLVLDESSGVVSTLWSASPTSTTATRANLWNLTLNGLPPAQGGAGPEGMTWIPDADLKSAGLCTSTFGWGGMIAVAHQAYGDRLFLFELWPNGIVVSAHGTLKLASTLPNNQPWPESCGVYFDPVKKYLWITHDAPPYTLQRTTLSVTMTNGQKTLPPGKAFALPADIEDVTICGNDLFLCQDPGGPTTTALTRFAVPP